MSKILKQVRCGRMVYAVVYTPPAAGDGPRARAQKRKASSAARERLNARTSFAKLERVLAANFDDGDLFITLTYEDGGCPRAGTWLCGRYALSWPSCGRPGGPGASPPDTSM